jgi:predicted nucleotidyltransferase
MLPSENRLTLEYHDKLNPEIWEHGKLRPEIKEKLLEVAEAFLESIELAVDVEDITFTGSLANYNYTPYSDIDLHIITDLDLYKQDKELLKDYFKAKRTVWNSAHSIKIKGYDVEAYIQDRNEKHYATGVYSIRDDSWLVAPSKVKPANEKEVIAKVEAMRSSIEHALSDKCDVECAENIKDKILKTRAAGLERAGEFSVENLAYKELRRAGDIERLLQGVINKKDSELSLKQETKGGNFKTFMGGFSMAPGGKGSRGPNHAQKDGMSLNGARKITNPNTKGSLSPIAKVHREPESPFKEIENLKKKTKGKTYIIPQTAQAIAYYYGLSMEKVHKEPRGISTSGIVLGLDPLVNRYYVHKK